MIEKLFLSVGAMKAGTTWLYDKLKQHRDIHFSPQKEVHFLSHYYGHTNSLLPVKRQRRARIAMQAIRAKKEDRNDLLRLRRWYANYKSQPVDYVWFERLMEADKAGAKYLADFSNLNCFLTPKDWADIRQNHVRHLRVVYIMRDPVERTWSHFKYHLRFSEHPAAKQPDQDFTLFKDTVGKDWFWRNACYAETVSALTSGLASDQLKIAYFEDMISEPEQFLREIEAFIGLPQGRYNSDLRTPRNRSIATVLPQPWRSYLNELFEHEFRRLSIAGLGHETWITSP